MRRRLVPLIALCILVPAHAAQSQDRDGFTLLLSLGYGMQSGAIEGESGDGIGGLNLGIGGFVSDNTALMFRLSGTNVSYDYQLPFSSQTSSADFVSGVAVLDVQYWATNRLNLEFGGGFGFASSDYLIDDERGLGLLVGAGYSVLLRGKYSLQFGVEYAPVVLDEATIHNVGFNVGFQFL
jgi:hypothetical protein